jgi:hypothetical protein
MAKRTNGRDPKKERFWRQIIARQGKSGLSIRGFCLKRGVSEASFHFWRKELARRDGEPRRSRSGMPRHPTAKTSRPSRRSPSSGSRQATFVPVRVASSSELHASAPTIEIVLPSGHLVRVGPGVDSEALSKVVSTLETRRC